MRVTYPDKSPGDQHTSTMDNQLKDKANNPGLNDAWSSVVKFDDEYFPPEYAMSGPIEYTIDATNAGTGNGRKDTIVGDGNTIAFTGFTIRDSDLAHSSNVVTTIATHIYTIAFLRVGSVSEVYLRDTGETFVLPTITSFTMSPDNTFGDMVVSEASWRDVAATLPLLLTSINVVFADGGTGTATDWVASSIKKNDSIIEGSASALTGGENVFRIFGTLSGTPNGDESITVSPTDGASIYNSSGNAMDSGESAVDNLSIEVWTPNDLDNKVLWLPFGDDNITKVGERISQADDVWNSNNFTQNIDLNRPGALSGTSNDWGVFEAANKEHLIPPESFQTEMRSPFSLAFIVRPDDGQPAEDDNIYSVVDASPSSNNFGISLRTDGKLRVVYKANNNTAVADTAAAVYADGPISGYDNLIVTIDSTNIKIYFNGSEQTLDATNDGDMSGVTMGDYTMAEGPHLGTRKTISVSSFDVSFDGQLGDVIMVSDILTTQEISSLNIYLGNA